MNPFQLLCSIEDATQGRDILSIIHDHSWDHRTALVLTEIVHVYHQILSLDATEPRLQTLGRPGIGQLSAKFEHIRESVSERKRLSSYQGNGSTYMYVLDLGMRQRPLADTPSRGVDTDSQCRMDITTII